jgi:hypothetical protein
MRMNIRRFAAIGLSTNQAISFGIGGLSQSL